MTKCAATPVMARTRVGLREGDVGFGPVGVAGDARGHLPRLPDHDRRLHAMVAAVGVNALRVAPGSLRSAS